MLLSQLLQDLPGLVITDGPDLDIRSLAVHSEEVEPGAMFICVRGARADGHDFALQASRRGASAIISERPFTVEPPAGQPRPTLVLVSDTRNALGLLAAAFYRHPSDQLKLIGVTGTNGKTTTTFFIEAIMSIAGFPSGIIGTVGTRLRQQTLASHLTTPEPIELQRLLRWLADSAVTHVAMEVSSHALAMNRVEGCTFDTAVFTNLSRDHLDFHRTVEEYFLTKLKLFQSLAIPGRKKSRRAAILNADNSYSVAITREIAGRVDPIITYGLEKGDIRAHIRESSVLGTTFDLIGPNGSASAAIGIPGQMNVYNALAAAAVGFSEGVPWDTIAAALSNVSHVPGRLEKVDCGQDFLVFVDFAHNPGGLDGLLKTVDKMTPGRKIVVFGCKGGDSDTLKRRTMGRIAARHSDFSIITSDDPYEEDPGQIASQVEQGFHDTGAARERYDIVLNRREAIERAVRMALPGDAVIIAGRGHEPQQYVRGGAIPFSDRSVVEEVLRQQVGPASDSRGHDRIVH